MISYMVDGQGYLIISREVVSEDVEVRDQDCRQRRRGGGRVIATEGVDASLHCFSGKTAEAGMMMEGADMRKEEGEAEQIGSEGQGQAGEREKRVIGRGVETGRPNIPPAGSLQRTHPDAAILYIPRDGCARPSTLSVFVCSYSQSEPPKPEERTKEHLEGGFRRCTASGGSGDRRREDVFFSRAPSPAPIPFFLCESSAVLIVKIAA